MFFIKLYPIIIKKTSKTPNGTCRQFFHQSIHQNDKNQITQKLYMSDLEFKLIHNFFRITLSSIRYAKNTNTDTIASTTCIYQFTICQTTIVNEEFRNKNITNDSKRLMDFLQKLLLSNQHF